MKITDTTNHSQKKTTWSLQDNKRTEAERSIFKPTGKTPKSKTLKYVLSFIGVMLVSSYVLVLIYDKPLSTCITYDFCINSIDNTLLYALYVFINMAIVILAIMAAYLLGKNLRKAFNR